METLALPVLQADAPYDISFHFDTKTVTLNSGYEMPIYDLGTYSGRNGAYQSATKNTIGTDIGYAVRHVTQFILEYCAWMSAISYVLLSKQFCLKNQSVWQIALFIIAIVQGKIVSAKNRHGFLS